ncbi:MAG: dienelactone hydrolase family protein [Gammaproteobacteria bacterium]|nr:dienelactone hydrolase family protein [Gammaproteobacteria bacterium]
MNKTLAKHAERRLSQDVTIMAGDVELAGLLAVPRDAHGLVAFAHGSGSSRLSSRNQHVAETLNRAGLATLLFDLLTPLEHTRDMETSEYRFDIALLAERLVGAIDWLARNEATKELRYGLFGASTGAAAALIAAAQRPHLIHAVVSRGGRPDLANDILEQVHAPTLLIVGGQDTEVIELNRWAAARLTGPHETVIVAGADHLFEAPGQLEEVARLAGSWFLTHLTSAA